MGTRDHRRQWHRMLKRRVGEQEVPAAPRRKAAKAPTAGG
jgi:hypothetical protein